jgi:hypothetical protein
MVRIEIEGDTLHVEPQGWHKLWALKSHLDVPLTKVRAVRADPDAARSVQHRGLRLPGTYVPGLITAGTYYKAGERTFWDVRRPERAIVIELEGARYKRLVVEVEDPAYTVRRIETAMRVYGARLGTSGRA